MSLQESKSLTVGFRLSPQQERLLDTPGHDSVVQCAATLSGVAGEPELRSALEAVVARHEILRTTFPRQVGVRGRSQVIHDVLAPEWSIRTLITKPTAEVIAEAMADEAERPFDLDQGPLVRALLMPREGNGILILTVHAACADAASLMVVLRELADAYRSAAGEEPIQYADYAEWRHELMGGDDDEAQEGRAFWASQAEQRPETPRLLFADRDATPERAQRVAVPFEAGELDRLRAAAAAAGAAPAEFLEACWHALIARLCAENELVLSGWCAGRDQPDLDSAVGPFSQPVPVASRLEAQTTFTEVLDQVRRARAEASRRQDFATGPDLRAVDEGTVAAFVHIDPVELAAPLRELAAVNPSGAARLLLVSSPAQVDLWHDPAAHDRRDGAQIAASLRTLALSVAADPAQPVLGLPLIEAADRASLLEAGQGPEPASEAATPVPARFAAQAALTPDAPAVADAARELSYAELDAASNRLAHFLQAAGVEANTPVALCLERTTRLLEAVLAVLKSGGAYLPLNYEHPQARLAHQLSESGAAVLLTEEHLLDRLPKFDGRVVCLDTTTETVEFGDGPTGHQPAPEDLAYIMYTSGSTGLPKGVAVTHGNLSNYAAGLADLVLADSDARGVRFGVVSAITTDLGNTCIFPPLVAGGCVQLVSPGAAMDASTMAAELAGRRLDVLKITPSHLRALLAGEQAGAVLPSRWLILGGEALSWELVERIRELAGDCRVMNHYGPTETTVGCCAMEVGQARRDAATAPIGRPLPGVRAHVLDQALEPLPAGVPGELCVAGDGVARGYVGDSREGPFVPYPFGAGAMYRTGDRARMLRDGAIEFLGRIDDQVKVRGFRIEPGEIEAVLSRHPAVRQAAVVPERDERGETRLVAYLACSSDPSVEELQAFLSRSLPDYMVPSAFATLDSLPFTPSGKVDRRALPELAAVQTRRGAEYVAPRDPVEEQIAGIWSELLGVDQVGVHDDFFALGGHSLLATQAIMRIRRIHGDIPLRALLAAPTVADLAEVVRSAGAARAEALAPDATAPTSDGAERG